VAYGNRELGRLVDEPPERAIAFAGLAGAAVLLMDDARPHLKRLRERLVEGARPEAQAAAAGTVGVDGTPVVGGAALDAAAVPDGGGLDLSGVDLSGVDLSGVDLSGVDLADLGGFDLGALDGLDAAFDAVGAIDAGVDSGAGSGDGGGAAGAAVEAASTSAGPCGGSAVTRRVRTP
jgi:hypothetical protein